MATRIIPEDELDFEHKIKLHGEKVFLKVLCSFTYITPNYDILSSFIELRKFTEGKNIQIYVVLWDMNALANPYFKKYCSDKISSPQEFIDKKSDELGGIIQSVGFTKNEIIVVKSSEIWSRLINYKKENLFQSYFSVLARIPVNKYTSLRKASHLFQIVLDLFFSLYFNKLEPELTSEPIDLLFSDYYKIDVYKDVRTIMGEEGYISSKPLFLLMHKVPYIVYEEKTPEWNMELEEIYDIVQNCDCTKTELCDLLKYFEVSHKTIMEKDYLVRISKALYVFLQKYREIYRDIVPQKNNAIGLIKTNQELLNLGQTLKSELALQVLRLCDGQHSITNISQKTKKSISTISQYLKELKIKKYIEMGSDRKPLRVYDGFSINFEKLE